MKLKEYKKTYEWFSGKASDVTRQLAFAGIAVVWIFKIQSQGNYKIPNELILPLGYFCVGLAFDLLQYILGYLIWFLFFKYHEISGTHKNRELDHSGVIPLPLHFCMVLKVIFVVLGFYKLIVFIYSSRL